MDPSPPKRVQDLEDELTRTNIEWAQAFTDLKNKFDGVQEKVANLEQKVANLEQKVATLEELRSVDIKYICTLVINEMIEKISCERINSKRKLIQDTYDNNEKKNFDLNKLK